MDDSPDIRVDYLRLDAQRRELNPPDMQERFKRGKYDVYIIGDLDSGRAHRSGLAAIGRHRARWRGFDDARRLAQFRGRRLRREFARRVLPIEIGRFERQSFGEPIRTDLHLAGSPQMRLTGLGKLQSLLQIDSAGTNESAWKALPPLDGANKFVALKPGCTDAARIRARRTVARRQELRRRSGAGLCWRLDMALAVAWVRLATQTLLATDDLVVAQKDQRQDGKVWVRLDRRRFAPGMRVEFAAGARNETGDTPSRREIHGRSARTRRSQVARAAQSTGERRTARARARCDGSRRLHDPGAGAGRRCGTGHGSDAVLGLRTRL